MAKILLSDVTYTKSMRIDKRTWAILKNESVQRSLITLRTIPMGEIVRGLVQKHLIKPPEREI